MKSVRLAVCGLVVICLAVCVGSIAVGQTSVSSGPIRSTSTQTDQGRKVCNTGVPEPCFQVPEPIYQPDPEYPEKSRQEKTPGTVIIHLVVTREGTPTRISVKKGPGDAFIKAAVKAVKTWRFKPGTYDGKPVETAIMVEIKFVPR